MAVKIKLKRLGKIREPYYRIVIADSRTKRDGRAIEEIGKYHPKAEPSLIEVNSERVQHWLSVGAQPTDPVRVLLKITGDWQKFTGQSGSEGTLKKAEPRADKKERFDSAAKESQASKDAKDDKGAAKAATKTARPAKDTPAKDAPAKDTPAKGAPAKESAAKSGRAKAAEAPVAEAPVAEAPAAEAPAAEAPAAEAPAAEAPAAEAPAEDAPAAEAPAADDSAAPEVAAVAEADDGEPGSGS